MPFLRAVQSHLYIDSVVRQSRPQISIDRTFIKQPLELNGDAGDQYTGLDRFGRVSELNWFNTNTSASVDRYQYTFDRNSNRTRRDNVLNNNFSERYDYDNLGQLTTFERANSIEKSWNFDALGNWESVTQGASTQTRTHNVQNEITSVSGQASPTYDLNGNQTRDFTGQTFTFDAWNRLVKVTPSGGGAPIREYEYDASFRRIEETAGTTTIDFYYSANWQVLEEHVDNTLESQFVWSPTYIDALILRDRDADGNSSNGLEERLWVVRDANYNVTALVNSNGVVERFAYDPFGSAQILDNSWNTHSASAYSWDYLHQGLRYDAGIDKYHVRFRDYDPQSGRWMSMDPIGFAAGDVNLYRGVGNDFVGNVDPSGLFGGPLHYGRSGYLAAPIPGATDRMDAAIEEERKRGIQPTQFPELSPRVSGTINLVTGIAYMAIGIATAESGFGAVIFVAGVNRFLQGGKELIEDKHSPTPAQNIAKATGISGADQGMQNLETFFDIFAGLKGASRCPAPKTIAPNRLPVPQGHTRVYRAVSEAEYQQIMKTGKFEVGPGGADGKWFADSVEGAVAHGKGLYHDVKFRLIEADVPDNARSLFKWDNLDGKGPARYLDLDDLQNVRPRPVE